LDAADYRHFQFSRCEIAKFFHPAAKNLCEKWNQSPQAIARELPDGDLMDLSSPLNFFKIYLKFVSIFKEEEKRFKNPLKFIKKFS
jgi:hypothetical protein